MHAIAHFFQRIFPSANMVWLKGTNPALVDTGFGSDFATTLALLNEHRLKPEQLSLIVNTHYHCDHVGGNHQMQRTYNIPIAAHRWEAALVNRRDREACSANWLGQAIEPYTVQRPLSDGDIIDTGLAQWQVIHTPGHTQGHISLFADGILIAGDTVHSDDVAWLNIFREGVGAIERMLETLDRLAALPIQISYSGHGAATENPQAQLDYARRRYEKWQHKPQKIAWHATKRIFIYYLMLVDGANEEEIAAYLARSPWYYDYCVHIFGETPQNMIAPLLKEVERSKAASWKNGRLIPTMAYNPAPPSWLEKTPSPIDWPMPTDAPS